jgi:hypothetical protein
MLKAAAFIAALLFGAPALAQNVTCFTAATGDRTNKCASTAFVQAAIASPASNIAFTDVVNQFAVGQYIINNGANNAQLTVNNNVFQISIPDQRDAGLGNFWSPVFINHTINKTATPAITGHRNTITADLTADGLPSSSFINVAQLTVKVNTGAGKAFAFNPYAWAAAGADAATELQGGEINMRAEAPVTYKVGLQIIPVAGDAFAATGARDAGLLFAKQNSALGFKNAIQFGAGSGQGAATDNLMYATATGATYVTALDLHEVAGGFSGGAIVFPAPPAAAFIKWGASGQGGEIRSNATASGPEAIFSDDLFAVQFGGSNGLLVTQTSVAIGGCTIGTNLFCVGTTTVNSSGYLAISGINGDYVYTSHGANMGLRISHAATETKIEGVNNTITGSYQPLSLAGSMLSLKSSATEVIGISLGESNFTGYQQMTEMTAPAAPAANQLRIFSQDNGAGKTQLMAIFATGAAQQIAIQP